MTQRRRTSGFTLIEMMVAIAVIGALITAASLTVKNLTRSDLRSAARRTSAAMRFAFDRATLTGSYLRLVFDLDKGEIWAEATESRVALRMSKEDLGEESKSGSKRTTKKAKTPLLPFLGSEKTDKAGGEQPEGEMAPIGIDSKALTEEWEQDLAPPEKPKPEFQALKGPGSKRIKLARGISVSAVVTPRMTEPVEKGKAYVYFFPQGNSEPAIIHFVDRDEEYYSVVLHPVTGQAKVYPCLYRVPDDFGVSDDKRRRVGKDSCASQGGL